MAIHKKRTLLISAFLIASCLCTALGFTLQLGPSLFPQYFENLSPQLTFWGNCADLSSTYSDDHLCVEVANLGRSTSVKATIYPFVDGRTIYDRADIFALNGLGGSSANRIRMLIKSNTDLTASLEEGEYIVVISTRRHHITEEKIYIRTCGQAQVLLLAGQDCKQTVSRAIDMNIAVVQHRNRMKPLCAAL